MPGYFLTSAATLQCFHGGPITITPSAPALTVAGSPVLTVADAAAAKIACSAPQPPLCVLLQWNNIAGAVTENGASVLLVSGSPTDAQCLADPVTPLGPPKITGVQIIAEGV